MRYSTEECLEQTDLCDTEKVACKNVLPREMWLVDSGMRVAVRYCSGCGNLLPAVRPPQLSRIQASFGESGIQCIVQSPRLWLARRRPVPRRRTMPYVVVEHSLPTINSNSTCKFCNYQFLRQRRLAEVDLRVRGRYRCLQWAGRTSSPPRTRSYPATAASVSMAAGRPRLCVTYFRRDGEMPFLSASSSTSLIHKTVLCLSASILPSRDVPYKGTPQPHQSTPCTSPVAA